MPTLVYDYVIVGAGPAGLTCAYLLAKIGRKCLILDNASSIGGCHRVVRVSGLMTEHSPRVYSGASVNFMNILKCLNLDFHDLFIKYKFDMKNVGLTSLSKFSIKEVKCLFLAYLQMAFKSDTYSKRISVFDFMVRNNFSHESIEYSDRICRVSDGTNIHRFTLYEFLHLFDDQILYNLYQPKVPNDVGLFKKWQEALEALSVEFLLNTQVEKIQKSNDQKLLEILSSSSKFLTKNVILCVPPTSLYNILHQSNIADIFRKDMKQWAMSSAYMYHRSLMFYWNKPFPKREIWGLTETDWGVVYIFLSDYMSFPDDHPKVVMSIIINRPYTFSKATNKIALECNDEEIFKEVYRQLRLSMPELPKYDLALMNPMDSTLDTILNSSKMGNHDNSFVRSKFKDPFISPVPLGKKYKGLHIYNAGTANGLCSYSMTTIETAITNAISVVQQLEPETKLIIEKQNSLTFSSLLIRVFYLFIFIIFVLVSVMLIIKLKS